MKPIKCEDIQTSLIEYIESELPKEKTAYLLVHLEKCDACRTEYKEMQKLLNQVSSIPVDEPDKEFWQEFPDKVLEAVRSAKRNKMGTVNNVVAITSAKTKVTTKTSVANPSKWSLPKIALPVAAAILVAVGVTLYSPKQAIYNHNIIAFQDQVSSINSLSPLTSNESSSNQSRPWYSFSSQPSSSTPYSLGAIYTETLANIATADIDNKKTHVQKLLDKLTEAGSGEQTTNALKLVVTRLDKGENDLQQYREYIAKSYAEYAVYLDNQEKSNRVMFELGAWNANFSAATYVQPNVKTEMNSDIVRKESNNIRYFIQQLSDMAVPVSSVEALNKIQAMLTKKMLSKQDFDRIHQLNKKLQLLFG